MSQNAVKQFHKRFAKGIEVRYAKSQGSPAEQEFRNLSLRKAIREVFKGLLKRDPTEEELSGHVDISKLVRLPRRKTLRRASGME